MARRSYPVSSSMIDEAGELLPPHTPDVEFYIVLVKPGQEEIPPGLTPRLFMLGEGDRLYLGEKITGHYTLEGVKPTDTVLFLSTGTGEAPHNYLLWELLQRHKGHILAACACATPRPRLPEHHAAWCSATPTTATSP